MKNICVILFLLLCACREDGIQDLRSKKPVLVSILRADSFPDKVQYFAISEDLNMMNDVAGVNMKITDDEGQSADLYKDGAGYAAPADFIVRADHSYRFDITDGIGSVVNAMMRIPPQIELLDMGEDSVVVLSPDQILFELSWTALDPQSFSYVMEMENLEQTKTELPFIGGKFSDRYALPQLEANLTLTGDDFKYYGLHRINVYAIDKSYESVFFYDPSDLRGLVRQAPDNVSGGEGFVTGTSGFSIMVYLEM